MERPIGIEPTPNLGKVREAKSNALERGHLADLKEPSIGK
jgi:hypothetical protein